MESEININKKCNQLIEYYNNIGIQIIGLNDIQGLNYTFLKKGILEYLKEYLTNKTLTPSIINAFSLLINQPTYIDYFLENNLSLEEIKLSQNYSTLEAIEKNIKDLEFLELIKSFTSINQITSPIKNKDNQIFLADIIKKSKEPIIIYSSGISSLIKISTMYEYLDNFDQIIESIKLNFENILSLNEKTDIYVISTSINKNDPPLLTELKKKYNEKLKELCFIYNLTYIDTSNITKFNNQELAKLIIDYMYKNKITNPIQRRHHIESNLFITNNGPKGIIEDLIYDYKKSILTEQEYLTKERILKKVLKKSTTTRNSKTY